MATYSNNTTIKIGSNITYNITSIGSFSFTVPANSAAQISSFEVVTGGSTQLSITYPSGLVELYNTSTSTSYTPFKQFPAGTIFSGSVASFFERVRLSGMILTNTP